MSECKLFVCVMTPQDARAFAGMRLTNQGPARENFLE